MEPYMYLQIILLEIFLKKIPWKKLLQFRLTEQQLEENFFFNLDLV